MPEKSPVCATPALPEYDWCMGFWAASYLFAGHYDSYAELHDEYIAARQPRQEGGEDADASTA